MTNILKQNLDAKMTIFAEWREYISSPSILKKLGGIDGWGPHSF